MEKMLIINNMYPSKQRLSFDEDFSRRKVKCIKSVSQLGTHFWGLLNERDEWEITKRELAFYNFATKGGETR